MTAVLTLPESGLARFDGLPDGFRSGFTTRRLTPDGTSPENALRILADALGAPLAERVRLRQVHGRTVLRATGPLRPGEDVLLGEGDAVVTAEPSRLLAVQTADCVPILLLDPETGLLAAVHAGWRGTALRILDPVLDLLESLGAKPGNLVALFGPSISRDAYEVGPEVIEALTRAQSPPEGSVVAGTRDRSFVDVAAFCAAQLVARGVSRIQRGDFCTLRSPELFPSYRRDGKRAGRIFTGIVRQDPR